MCSHAEKLADPERESPLGLAVKVGEWNSRPRRRKAILLPQFAKLRDSCRPSI